MNCAASYDSHACSTEYILKIQILLGNPFCITFLWHAWLNLSINLHFSWVMEKKVFKIQKFRQAKTNHAKEKRKLRRSSRKIITIIIILAIKTALNCHAKICWLFSIYHHRQLLSQSHMPKRRAKNRIEKTKISIKRKEKKKNRFENHSACTSLIYYIYICVSKADFAGWLRMQEWRKKNDENSHRLSCADLCRNNDSREPYQHILNALHIQ